MHDEIDLAEKGRQRKVALPNHRIVRLSNVASWHRAALGVPFLGEVPLHMAIREKSDAGLPVVATEPDGPHARIYRDIAARVREQLAGAAGRAAPKIVIEA